MTGTEDLVALGRLFVAFPGGDLVEGATLGTAAVSLAASGLAVFPLGPRAKEPLHTCPINRAHRAADRTDRCRGGCGHDGHGVLDATTDLATVTRRWAATPTANIGGAVPTAVVVIDVDPRNGGD
ncbi:MAG: bifunctional DNA primase/polymerase, partial [Acidimicrobiales bacterium]